MNHKSPEMPNGKPADTPLPQPGSGPLPASREVQPIIFSIRGSQEWRAWLKQFAEHRRVTPTALLDQVLAETARREGFDAPPPRRPQSPSDHDSNPRGR